MLKLFDLPSRLVRLLLRFSESIWRKWLNLSSLHNRYRLWDDRWALVYGNAVELLQVVASKPLAN